MPPRTLLIIAHGSRSSAWNHAIETFCSNIRSMNKDEADFDQVTWCYLEHASPSIPEALEHTSRTSGAEIIALPLFLTMGQHIIEDIPRKLEKVAKLVSRQEGVTHFECQGRPVLLLDPPPTMDLLADNFLRRYKRHSMGHDNPALLIVYYGSKRFMSSWNHLGFSVQSSLIKQLPGIQINWVYCGEAVDFSPEPLEEAIKHMARLAKNVVVLPAMVSVGMVQNNVVPTAIQNSGLKDQIIYEGDSILPDSDLEKHVVGYIQKMLNKQ